MTDKTVSNRKNMILTNATNTEPVGARSWGGAPPALAFGRCNDKSEWIGFSRSAKPGRRAEIFHNSSSKLKYHILRPSRASWRINCLLTRVAGPISISTPNAAVVLKRKFKGLRRYQGDLTSGKQVHNAIFFYLSVLVGVYFLRFYSY